MYTIDGVTNKYKVFQEYYFEKNKVELTYSQALSYYSQLSKDELEEFAKYYQDETGYEIITANGTSYGEDAQYTDTGLKKKVKKKIKTKDGSFGGYETREYTVYSTNANKANIMMKYSMEAYAKKSGQILDPVWSQYSAEEIIAMEDTGVNIPKDILELAHAIQENTSANYDNTGEQTDNPDETSEKMPFLEAVKVAQKKIEACEENDNKIEDQINDLMPEKDKQERTIKERLKEQEDAFDRFKKIMKDWTNLQDKVNKGEALTTSESKRYLELREMFENEDFKAKSKNSEYAFDENEIAKSLNMINILAAKGEILGDETEAMGELLADYTSKNNFKTTRKEVRQTLGFFATFIAMVKGKKLATLATEVGEETKEFSTDSIDSANEIASILDIEDRIIDPRSNNKENMDSTEEDAQQVAGAEQENAAENTNEQAVDTEITEEVTNTTAETSETSESAEAPANAVDANAEDKAADVNNTIDTNETTDSKTQTDNKGAKGKDNEEEKFVVNNENVLELTGQAADIKGELLAEIKEALKSIKVAKSDKKFAMIAEKKVAFILKKYQKDEEKRQNEVKQLEESNNESKKELERLTGKSSEEIDKDINGNTKDSELTGKDSPADDDTKDDVEKHRNKIISNNKEITDIQSASENAKEEFAQKTAKEKDTINKQVPVESIANERHTTFLEKDLPEKTQQLSFTKAAGITLTKIGKILIARGIKTLTVCIYSRKAIEDIREGSKSVLIGTGARAAAGGKMIPKLAKATSKKAAKDSSEALEKLNAVDQKIISVTEEEGADNSTGEENQEQADKTENTENSAETTAPAENHETTQTASQTETPVQEAPAEAASESTSVENVQEELKNTEVEQNDKNTNVTSNNVTETDNKNDEENTQEAINNVSSTSNTSSSEKKEEITTDKAQDNVDDTKASAKDDNKDTLETKKDTEKTTKELEKETKNLTKLMKKDEKDIIKMTKESIEAAKKQEEILTEYEALVAENEKLIEEDENNKQNQSPAQAAPQQQADGGEEGSMPAVAAFSVMDSKQNNSGNSDKINSNDARINELGIEFTTRGKVIDRNKTKITKLQKTTKKRQKKYTKKTKVIEQKNKEAEKKEIEKQKKLAKQLGIVGVAENVFQVTLSTGQIMCMVVAPPWIPAAGTVMVTIGEYGVLSCGLTKGVINIANGNLTAGLMSIGQSALSVVTGGTNMQQGAGSVLQAVSAGLNIVSSSASLVNNVRAIEGKEANGVFSKISTIAGVASSLTSSAASLQDLGKNGASTFGKSMKIAGAVGSAATSASQLMTEFGGESNLANILGMVGGAVSTVAALGMLADKKFGNASEKNKENQEKTENDNETQGTSDKKDNKQTNPDAEPSKAKADKPTENSTEGTISKKSSADDVLADNGNGIVESYSGMSEEQIAAAKAQIERRNTSAGTSEIVSSASLEDLGLTDSGTKLTGGVLTSTSGNDGRFKESDKALNGLVSSTSGTMPSAESNPSADPIKQAMKGADMNAVTESAKVKMNETGSKIKEQQQQQIDKQIKKQQRKETLSQVADAVSGALGVGQSVLSMGQNGQANTATKKPAPAGRLTKRAKEIMKKNNRRIAALSGKGYSSLNKRYA